MIEKRWIVCPPASSAKELALQLGVDPIIGQILYNRGIADAATARAFLRPSWDTVPSPWRLHGIEQGVHRILQALEKGESICIYGDYDVDGQTSTALLVRFFRSLARDPQLVQYYIPHRMEEGYGLNSEAIRELAAQYTLMITVDCGIVALAEVAEAQAAGMDVIITDHHEPEADLPEATAVINPHQPQCSYPFAGLAGVGVAFQLVRAVAERLHVEVDAYLDLVALGTTADLVPLVAENRFFVQAGLKQLAATENQGLRALAAICGLKPPFKAADFGYRIGPRLNAVGRLGDPSRGVQLLLTADPAEAARLAGELDEENRARQEVEQGILAEAVDQVEARGWQQEPVLVVAGEGWHPGVIGIVASRLLERYYRPTVVIAIDEHGIGKGSARSIEGFHMFQALQACRPLLVQFGGHAMAAGLTIAAERIDHFRRQMAELATAALMPEDYIPQLLVDAELPLERVTESFVQQLEQLEPCGMKNPAPTLQVEGSILDFRPVGREQNHAKIKVQDGTHTTLDGIAFSLAEKCQALAHSHDWMRLLVEPQINVWQNRRSLQVLVRDMQPSPVGHKVIQHWLQGYPWALSSEHRRLPATDAGPNSNGAALAQKLVDVRGHWQKYQWVLENCRAAQPVWFVVHTAEEALHVCRELRIAYPGNPSHIGFVHGLLSAQDVQQIREGAHRGELRWLVAASSHIPWPEVVWDSVVHWFPPLRAQDWYRLLHPQVRRVVALFGADDAARLQVQIQQSFPERLQLAQFYRALLQEAGPLSWKRTEEVAAAANVEPGLEWALAVFTELRLVRQQDDSILLMPPPEKKLDLNSSVLYNEGMEKRQQYLDYVRHCMERGSLSTTQN